MKPIDKRIDSAVKEIVEGYGSSKYFTKDKVVGEICARKLFSRPLGQLAKQFPGTGFDEIVVEYIEKRLSSFLQQNLTYQSARGPIKVRVYENYAAGTGPRRWRPLQSMSATELRTCLAARTQKRASDDRVIRVYQRLLNLLLEMLGEKKSEATVKDVWQEALDQAIAELTAIKT